ncbi:MAG: transporter [Proteobacteria bacterium ST_bin11]|jgi:uncharacterized membrane protein YedE/YeeE|nr:MAG: transporter [Proteobacteria bacterium ST_bin11]
MKNTLCLFGYGLLFGLGLLIAGMSNPAKVLAFLDVAGDWDPSLALVMASALSTLASARYLMQRNNDMADGEQESFGSAPKGVDGKLLAGAAVFGVGWGLSGFCPGPALLGLTAGVPGNYTFVTAMFIGFGLFRFLHQR